MTMTLLFQPTDEEARRGLLWGLRASAHVPGLVFWDLAEGVKVRFPTYEFALAFADVHQRMVGKLPSFVEVEESQE